MEKQSSKSYKNTLLVCQARSDCGETSSLRKDDSPVHGLSEMIVGVLGGGQLGRMLCQAASQMSIKLMVLDPLENCPASALSYDYKMWSLTVEIEHVDVATLEKLEQQEAGCQPKASACWIIQDLEGARSAGHLFGYPLMVKSKRLAYDGSGNAVAKNEEELSSAITGAGCHCGKRKRQLYLVLSCF